MVSAEFLPALRFERNRLRGRLRGLAKADPERDAVQRQLRAVKSRLYYWEHKESQSFALKRSLAHARRRQAKLRQTVAQLRALPADHPVSLSRTAGEKAEELEGKLLRLRLAEALSQLRQEGRLCVSVC